MYIKKIIVAILLIGLVVIGIFSYKIYQALLVPNTLFSASSQEIYIKTGASFEEVFKELRPLLKKPETFRIVAVQKGYANNVKPGKYTLKKGMNNKELIRVLRIGNQPIKVSFNNQERVENLAGRIAQQIEADSVSLIKAFTNENFLKKNNLNKKTALSLYIPNTYEFYWNTSAEQFRDRMLKEYHRFWNENRKQKAQKQGLTPQEIITLASIVQKETTKVDERPRVAGVYLNRLKVGMPLQADPTVIYAIKEHTGRFDTIIKRVYRKHLEIPSAYNTYMYYGIPPGPITMPDISSIEAVLNPENHDFYYFVADTQRWGYHLFSRTLKQHNQYSEKYHKWANANKVK